MAYIYKKVIGGKPYYYLRISTRVGGKINIKDIAYLGDDLSKINSQLDKIPEKYKHEIRKGYKTLKKFIDSNVYLEKIKKLKIKSDLYFERDSLEKVEAIKLHFNNYFLKLDRQTIFDTYKNFLIEFAYNTTSIEGNTITLKEADKLLRENLTPKERAPREIFDLQNTEKVFFYLLEEKPEFNQDLIIKIHDMLIENIDARKGYRTTDIRVFKSHFEASPGKYVKTDMNIFMQWYEKHKNLLHPFVLAALFHQKLEKIHPFSDGNGRTGRMLMIYLLLKNSYPSIIIQKKNRGEYLSALASADQSPPSSTNIKYFKLLVNYLASEYFENYWKVFNI